MRYVLLLLLLTLPVLAAAGLTPDADHDVVVVPPVGLAIRYNRHTVTAPVRVFTSLKSSLTREKPVVALIVYEDWSAIDAVGEPEKVAIEVFEGEPRVKPELGVNAFPGPPAADGMTLNLGRVDSSMVFESAPDKAMRPDRTSGFAWTRGRYTYAVVRKQSRVGNPNPVPGIHIEIDAVHADLARPSVNLQDPTNRVYLW